MFGIFAISLYLSRLEHVDIWLECYGKSCIACINCINCMTFGNGFPDVRYKKLRCEVRLKKKAKTDLKWPNVEFLVFLTIIISIFDGQIFGYKQLPLIVIMMMPYNRLPKANNFGVIFDFTLYITPSIKI